MHQRNIYRVQPDYADLARAYPPLKEHLIPATSGARHTIDFKNEASQRCLTKALLHRDFGLQVNLPEDRLCPPVPNRLNYLLWIQDILLASHAESTVVRGIDIGTGASSIYPLLGCKLDSTWTFVATELDPHSLRHASANIRANDLESRIRLVQAEAEGEILPLTACAHERFDFTMCNPPFYGSMEEVARSAEDKEFEPNAVCTGAPVEMVTRGGEAGFVSRMIQESLLNRSWCRWYTSMLGLMSSLTEVVKVLRELDITNYAITEFVQGQTRRWAIGWSFTDERLPDALSRIANPRSLMPMHTTIRQLIPAVVDLVGILSSMDEIQISGNHDGSTIVKAKGDTWSRSARRRRKRPNTEDMDTTMDRDVGAEGNVRLVCTIRVEGTIEGHAPEIVYQWMRGEDHSLFESFCSHVSRKALAR